MDSGIGWLLFYGFVVSFLLDVNGIPQGVRWTCFICLTHLDLKIIGCDFWIWGTYAPVEWHTFSDVLFNIKKVVPLHILLELPHKTHTEEVSLVVF